MFGCPTPRPAQSALTAAAARGVLEQVEGDARRLGVFARAVFECDRSAKLTLRLLSATMDNTIADRLTAQQLSHALQERRAIGVQ
jgi:hypothetical protein